MSRPMSTIVRTPVSGVQRYRLQKPVRSALNQSDPSGAHSGWTTDSVRSPPATTVRSPPASTISRVASHGMSGWSHSSQQKASPSGRHRGLETKSGPPTTTSGVDGLVASRRTMVLTTSPSPACASWTHRIVEPSGETSPSA